MKIKPIKRKRQVEIYFVLYIAALILLLPVKNKFNDNTGNTFFGSSFEIWPEKTLMNCKLEYRQNTPYLVYLDSTNIIHFQGDIKNVDYSVRILNQSNSEIQKINIASNPHFSMKKLENIKSAEFLWNPPLDRLENTEYIVKITASALDIDSDKILTATTEFLLNVFIDGDISTTNGREIIVDNRTNQSQANAQDGNAVDRNEALPIRTNIPYNNIDLNLFFEQSKVTALARKKWKNKCIVSGIDNKIYTYDSRPKIEVIPATASAEITYIGKDSIIVEGVTPSYGEMTVKLFVKRNDQQNTLARFKVEPLRISEPDVPKYMYPNITYRIDPALPITSFNNLEAYLQNSDGANLAYSQGEEISYTPTTKDVGKEFTFFRKSDNEIYGQKYYVKVKDFENPEIERMQKVSDNQVYVWTKSHGLTDGKENYIADFEIEGNATYSELAGQYKENKRELFWTQSYSFIPKDPTKPFIFSIVAKDMKGKTSSKKQYPSK